VKELVHDLVAPVPLRPVRRGFRLARVEVFNWGTFHDRAWTLELGGETALMTGDIGSGKSTLVDAITTLLVPPQKLAYNKAAGAGAHERSLRSYVLGYYKSERGDEGMGARPVALRDQNTYSVILGCFRNDTLGQDVTLAQVFWMKDGSAAKAFVLADRALAIKDDFANFGSEVQGLIKRLKRSGHEVFDSFPRYGAGLRRRFGLENEQALELFHQTVSMKSVGNLTDFVRQHMLEPSGVEERIAALIGHFDDLNKAHEAVLQARAQIHRLTPLIADCDRHAEIQAGVDALRACREALGSYFAQKKLELLEERIQKLEGERARLEARCTTLDDKMRAHGDERDQLREAIALNGGERIAQLEREIHQLEKERNDRKERAARYDQLAKDVALDAAVDAAVFADNLRALAELRRKVEKELSDTENDRTAAVVELHEARTAYDEIASELASLRSRRSNIPATDLEIRARLVRALDSSIEEDALPFAGELLEVRPEERDWEGAIERVLHNFGRSLLVRDRDYGPVAAAVERTQLKGRLVYFRVRLGKSGHERPESSSAASLVHKVKIKPESEMYEWLEGELVRRFDYVCCETVEQLRLEVQGLTRAGQIKGRGDRHEKDDRTRIDDRSRYVLGWSNLEKIAALEAELRSREPIIQALAARISDLQSRTSALRERDSKLSMLDAWRTFREIDWRSVVTAVHELSERLAELQTGSDVLQALQAQLRQLELVMAETERERRKWNDELVAVKTKLAGAVQGTEACRAELQAAPPNHFDQFARLEELRAKEVGEHSLTVESVNQREKDLRGRIQAKIDADEKRIERLAESIVGAMQAYRNDYPNETREADASVAAQGEYRAMLGRLQSDDLPRFEARFKELLNENTIREVAGFQSQLARERQTIKERIELINASLRHIDYNPGRYIALEPASSTDPEIAAFQQDLRACTEGTLTGSDDETYSEAKFLQVKLIIERFRGREGSAELDRRWTRKVSDVRTWFTFSASERWRETNAEYEHYTDSGGKSGGQKEKLAYTVLAASLAYQFGIDTRDPAASRTFRFVVIDEAFGRGSDESARYGLELFRRLELQLLIVTPLQKIHVIEPYVSSVGFIHNEGGQRSLLRNLTIEEYRAEREARSALP
jgi:uncharacterized protein YPO0396